MPVHIHNYYYQDENSQWVPDNGNGGRKRKNGGGDSRGGGRGGSGYAGGLKACWTCGETDHLQLDCPEWPDRDEPGRVHSAYTKGIVDELRDVVEENLTRGLWVRGQWFQGTSMGRSTAEVVDQIGGLRLGMARVEPVGRANGGEGVKGNGKEGKADMAKVEKRLDEGADRPTKRVKVEEREPEGADRPIKREYEE